MTRPFAALSLVLLLAACGTIRDSKVNPLNWFGPSAPAQKVEIPRAPEDGRPLIAQILDATIEPLPTGALLRVTGVPPSQGWWKAQLVAQPIDSDGTMVVEFRSLPPLTPEPAGTQPSRQITAALHISQAKLANLRQIIVQGAEDARILRR